MVLPVNNMLNRSYFVNTSVVRIIYRQIEECQMYVARSIVAKTLSYRQFCFVIFSLARYCIFLDIQVFQFRLDE